MISQYKICMGDRIKKLCFVLLKFHLNLLRFFELGIWHIAAIFWEQFSIHYANLRFWSSSLLLHSLYLEAYASFILNPPDSSSELSNIVVLFWFFFFYFFWQVVRFRDSVVHKICRFIGMNFLTNTSLSLSVHLQSRGGKDEDGDQAMGICFSPENHLEIYLFLNLYIIQLSLMGIQMLIRALFSR